jgi:hypothetical protein
MSRRGTGCWVNAGAKLLLARAALMQLRAVGWWVSLRLAGSDSK